MKPKYRAAVIGRTGRGNYGHGLDEVWNHVPEVQLVAVADDNKQGLADSARKLGVDQAFSDYRKMLDQVKPDVVSIGPRWLDQHHEMVLEAAGRGVHIYLEKPFCRTLKEADSMVRACESSHVKLAIAHQTRYSPKIRVVKDLIDQGKIGDVLEFRGRGKEDRRGGGEDLWVLGTHVMDLIRNFGGDPGWCMAAVSKQGRPIQTKDVVEGNEGIGPLAGDTVHAMYGMPHATTAYFASHRNMAARNSRFGLMIHGSRGVLWFRTGFLPRAAYLAEPSWVPDADGPRWQEISSGGLGVPEPLTDGGLHAGNVEAVKDLLRAIEDDRQPISSMYDARAAVEMIVAVFESQRTGRQAMFPLRNRENPLTMLG